MSQLPPQKPGPIGQKKSLSTGAIVGIVIGGALALLIICGGLAAAILLPAMGKARQAARQAVAQNNLRMISISLTQYTMENDGWFPEEGANLPARLSKYGVSPAAFQSLTPPPTGPSYYYVPVGPIEKITNPSTAIVIYENPETPSRMGWNVVFADGSVRAINDPAQYRLMIDGITLPDGTPYTPHTK